MMASADAKDGLLTFRPLSISRCVRTLGDRGCCASSWGPTMKQYKEAADAE